MKKINFAELMIETLQGEKVKYDCWLAISNALYMQGQNIVEHELGRKIYNTLDAEGHPAEVELTDDEAAIVKKYAVGFPYIIQKAIDETLKD